MISSRSQIRLIALLLALIGFSITWYKVEVLGIPLYPHDKRSVYNIGAEISFVGQGHSALISMAMPPKQEGIRILSYDASSADFGFTTAQTENGKRAEWSKRLVDGKQRLFYSIDAIIDLHVDVKEDSINPIKMEEETLSDYTKPVLNAAKTLLEEIHNHSADAHSFTALLIQHFNAPNPSQTVKMLLSQHGEDMLGLLYRLLRYEGISVRKIRGLYLGETQHNQSLIPMLEVYDNEHWQLFDLKEGKIPRAKNFFIWQKGGVSLLEAMGVKESKITFSVSEHRVPSGQIAQHEKMLKEAPLLNFSLFSLPVSQQNSFKHILLIPIGALVVVFLRILVGLRTSGTFMPILIALAFMQTSLIVGLIMFIVIVGVGLIIRSYLSHMNLLLVARISAVVIVVIAIMSVMSILSYKLGLNEVLSITFFPMIILAWTIERMSILWEEEGAKEVFIQGGGSLFVATLAYFAMSNTLIGHLTFNFPELLFVVLAIIIVLGTYSGYRLSELIRFKSMV